MYAGGEIRPALPAPPTDEQAHTAACFNSISRRASSFAPRMVSIFSPSLKKRNVGIDDTPSWAASSGRSSTSTLSSRALSPYSSASSWYTGSMRWHGPHHTAEKSSTTSLDSPFRISSHSSTLPSSCTPPRSFNTAARAESGGRRRDAQDIPEAAADESSESVNSNCSPIARRRRRGRRGAEAFSFPAGYSSHRRIGGTLCGIPVHLTARGHGRPDVCQRRQIGHPQGTGQPEG
eukprot:scaffold8772_cov116-Isochrysis_galbana.AAC.2